METENFKKKNITSQRSAHTRARAKKATDRAPLSMVSSKNARCTALLFLAVLLLSCVGMGRAARRRKEAAPEDNYPAEASESSPFPDFRACPKVELPPMPKMPTIPGFSFPELEPEADEP